MFVAPIDADDLWHPTKLEKQVDAALAAPEPPGFVYCFFRPIDADANLARPIAPYACRRRVLVHHVHVNFVGNGSGPLLSRTGALEVGGYDERLGRRGAVGCEDLLLQLQIARRYPVEVVPEFLVGYRTGTGGMSTDRRRMYRSWRVAIGILLDGEPDVPPRVLRWAHAGRCFELAEFVAHEGQHGECLRLLARALLARPAGDAGTVALPHHETPPPPDPAAADSGFASVPELQHD